MINNERLTLYFYRDGLSDKEYQDIQAEIEIDPELKLRYQQLCEQLDQLENHLHENEVPVATMRRWQNTLDRLGAAETKESLFSHWFHQPLKLAAMTAMVVLVMGFGVVIGLNLSDRQTLDISGQGLPLAENDAFAQGLRAYLSDTEMLLTGMDVGDSSRREQLIAEILSQNRMYISAAEKSNAPGLARVLRAFEPVLMSLAGDQNSNVEIQLAVTQLAFELNVVQTKLRHAASKSIQSL